MSVSYWMDSGFNNKITKDVVIVGGGFAGLATAFWIQKEDPSLQIALIEKYEIGDGASGRNAGFITCGSVEHFNRLVEKHGPDEAAAIWKFSEDNLALLKENIICDQPGDFLFEHNGSFSLASTESEFKELQESAKLMSKFNIDVERVGESDIQKRLGAEGFVGGIKYINDATVHPLKLLRGMRRKIEEEGTSVEFFENHEMAKIETVAGNKVVYTKKNRIEAPIVIYATNGYSPLLNDFFADKIFPTRGQILVTEKVPHFMEAACYANFVLDYFRQLPTGEILIGGFRQLQKDVETGYSDQTTDIIQSALEDFLQTHIPPARKAQVTHRWSGIMGFSVDGQPMVGALPTDPQLYFVGGFTAHGVGLAFHSGKSLVDTIFGRSVPDWISAKRLRQ